MSPLYNSIKQLTELKLETICFQCCYVSKDRVTRQISQEQTNACLNISASGKNNADYSLGLCVSSEYYTTSTLLDNVEKPGTRCRPWKLLWGCPLLDFYRFVRDIILLKRLRRGNRKPLLCSFSLNIGGKFSVSHVGQPCVEYQWHRKTRSHSCLVCFLS